MVSFHFEMAITFICPDILQFLSLGLCEMKWSVCSLKEFKQRIIATLESAAHNMLPDVWQSLDYRLDWYRVTGDGYIKNL